MKPAHRLPGSVLHGDCVQVLRRLRRASVDFVLTDPPYLVRYRDRAGRTIRNDDGNAWLEPAFAEIHRVMKADSFCVSFYGWNAVDRFMAAWKAAGLRPVAHLVFTKSYASSVGATRAHHECAYVLAKGRPQPLKAPMDVIPWSYTGNRLHPTEKPVSAMASLVEAYCPTGGVVLDPFCGSGSSLVGARTTGRRFIGIEIDAAHVQTARQRLRGLRR